MASPPSFSNQVCQVTDANGNLHGTTTTAGVSFAAGDIIGIALDWQNSVCWFNKNNGAWMGGGGNPGNPQTGDNPITIATGGGLPGLWPLCVAAFANAATVFTLKDTAASQTYLPPSGFSAW